MRFGSVFSLARKRQQRPFPIRSALALIQPFVFPTSQPAHPRLRRSSAISRFAVGAGLSALRNAGVDLQKNASRTALVFATSNGGVIYTKRFYHDIVTTGAQAASPLLFPETVFNAPASHLAAILGITGASYTLVGDAAVGILALQMANDLMCNEALDYCLVVAAEEVDWLLCDAYRKWRLLRNKPPIEPFAASARGMILSEGAGAVLLGRDGQITLDRVASGKNFATRKDAPSLLREIYSALNGKPEIIIASANGTFIDRAEEKAISLELPHAIVYTPKPALGEGVSAGTMWQVIAAAQALLTGQLPSVPHCQPENIATDFRGADAESLLETSCRIDLRIEPADGWFALDQAGVTTWF